MANKKETTSNENTFYCVLCGKTKKGKDFYTDTLGRYANGEMPYCRECLLKECQDPLEDYDMLRLQKVLREVNRPFLHTEWVNSLESDRDTVGDYFRKLNSLPQYQMLTWEDSIFEGGRKAQRDADIIAHNKEELRELMEKYGDKFETSELVRMEEIYKSLAKENHIVSYGDKQLLIMLVRSQIRFEDAQVDKNVPANQLKNLWESYINIYNQLGIGEGDDNVRSFGEMVREVEKEGFIPPWEKISKIIGARQDVFDKMITYLLDYYRTHHGFGRLENPPSDIPKLHPDEIDDEAPFMNVDKLWEDVYGGDDGGKDDGEIS